MPPWEQQSPVPALGFEALQVPTHAGKFILAQVVQEVPREDGGAVQVVKRYAQAIAANRLCANYIYMPPP